MDNRLNGLIKLYIGESVDRKISSLVDEKQGTITLQQDKNGNTCYVNRTSYLSNVKFTGN